MTSGLNVNLMPTSERAHAIAPPSRSPKPPTVELLSMLVQPATSPSCPAVLQPGQALVLQVLVHNRSGQPDRVQLSCLGLDSSQYCVQYPPQPGASGAAATDLALEPGEQGQITLQIQPSALALADPTAPLLCLQSAHQPALQLLDRVYLLGQPEGQPEQLPQQLPQQPPAGQRPRHWRRLALGLSALSLAGGSVLAVRSFGPPLQPPTAALAQAAAQIERAIAPAPTALPEISQLTATAAPRQGQERGSFALLRWQVSAADQIQSLRLVGRREDGSLSSPEQIWDLSQGLPAALQPVCQLGQVLVCQDLRLPVEPGSTVFELIAVPKTAGPADSRRQSQPLAIAPLPPEILSLSINGSEVGAGYTVPFSPEQPLQDIAIAWEVVAGPNTKVEILPAPGLVAPRGSLTYTLSQPLSRQTLTLRVTPAAGDPVTRSFTLEGRTGGSSAAGAAELPPLPPAGGAQPAASPKAAEPLVPTEAPPQFD